ncbi:MAG TPA: LysR family transcriptional regulator [Rubrivivax sp.]|jgi:DNA-binding transcriptional LysR family regulator|nr:LysR family transcriptional regulator [Rubrivivax sp.]
MQPLPANLDLNLLRVLVQVHLDRKVSQAADSLGMSQPAVSSALKRLREALGDRLFIPTARGMQATPLAEQIAPRVAQALAAIDETMACKVSFDAATSQRHFTIAMTDIGELHFLPPLARALRDVAPGVGIATVRHTAVNLRVEMEQGKVDLALGHLPDLSTDFHQRLLFTQRYMCLFRKGHALESAADPLAAYAQAEHALVLSLGTGHGRVDEFIDRTGLRRRIRLRVPHFVALTDVLESTDLVATVPEVFARRSAQRFALRFRPHPVDPPPIEIRAFWHAKVHQDPANRWLRELIVRLFGADDSRPADPAAARGRGTGPSA